MVEISPFSIIAKNMARTGRTHLEVPFGEFLRTELNDPERALSKVNLTTMEVSMF